MITRTLNKKKHNGHMSRLHKIRIILYKIHNGFISTITFLHHDIFKISTCIKDMNHTTERAEGLKSNTNASLYLLAMKWTTVDGTRRKLTLAPAVSVGEVLGESLKEITASSSVCTPTTVSSWLVSSCIDITDQSAIVNF